jgi:hypothetical protein
VKPAARVTWDPSLAHEVPVAVIRPGEETAVHVRNLVTSTAISRHYVMNFIPPEDVIDVLNAAGIRFLLAGAHAIGGWTNEPRLTQDVDVLVATRHVRQAIRALRAAYPHLQVNDTPVVTRFIDPESNKVVIDVMKPNQPLHRVALRYAHRIKAGGRVYDIPSLEYALAMKFAATVSPWRRPLRKVQDGVDFGNIVLANPVIDLTKLAKLGERVYPGGGKEILEMVRRVRAGESLGL